MFFRRKPQSLFEGVPGPSPWYLSPKTPPVPGFHWQYAGKGERAAGKTLLVSPEGPVAILNFYNYVLALADSSLLVWHQNHTDTGITPPIRLLVFRPATLSPLRADLDAQYERMSVDSLAILFDGEPSAEMRLPTVNTSDKLHAEFPEPLCAIDELLLLCQSSGITPQPTWEHNNLALVVAKPGQSSYQLYPQDWFNEGGFDYGYEWVTRVVRNPTTGCIHGEGIRIAPFVLDESLRRKRR
jgi:hypothetical protein